MPRHALSTACCRAVAVLASAIALAAQERPTLALEGRVVDLYGEPLPVAEIIVTLPGDTEVLARTFCDGEGRFRLARLPQQTTWQVRAALTGHAAASLRVAGTAPTPFLEFELAEAATVRGIVRDGDGAAVSGAVVRAVALPTHNNTLPRLVDGTTDAEGRFTLPDVALGPQRLVTIVPGTGCLEHELTIAGDVEVELTPKSLRARPPIRITVTGVAATDLDTVELSCAMRHRGPPLPLPPPHDALHFAADGTVTLTGSYAGPLVITLDAPGYAFSPRTRWLDHDQPTSEIAFEAQPLGGEALACRAVLRTADDNPLPGIDLEMAAEDGTARVFATSGADGSLVFDSALSPGEKCVVRSLDDHWVLEPMLAVEGRHASFLTCSTTVQAQHPMQLRASRAATVTGRVSVPDGSTASGLTVHLEEQMPTDSSWVEVATATTDRDGGYRCAGLHPKSGTLRLRVSSYRGWGESAPFSLAAGQPPTSTCDLALLPPSTVEGVVRDADGAPVVGVAVNLGATGVFRFRLFDQRIVMPPPRITDSRGRFRFPAVPSTTLIAYTHGDKSENVKIEPGEQHHIELTIVR